MNMTSRTVHAGREISLNVSSRSASAGSGAVSLRRPSVMCGENFLRSFATPRRAAKLSAARASAHSFSVSPAIPVHTTRGAESFGNPPVPRAASSNGPRGSSLSRSDDTAETVSSGISPQNFSVMCIVSGFTQRMPQYGKARFFDSIHAPSAAMWRGGSFTQTKVRRRRPASGGIQPPITGAPRFPRADAAFLRRSGGARRRGLRQRGGGKFPSRLSSPSRTIRCLRASRRCLRPAPLCR